jgi:superfamily II DNA or RNA helicase
MSGLLALRPYQQECIEAVDEDWKTHQRVAAVLAPGAGKTVIASHVIANAHAEGGRAVFVVHRDELVRQSVHKLSQVAPELSVGVVKAERHEIDGDVVVASVQTLSRANRSRIENVRLVIVDEVHHAAAESWVGALKRLGCFDPDSGVKMLGITATLERSDNKAMSDIIEKVSYSRDVIELIRDGHLVPVRGRRVRVEDLDLSDVRITGGDLSAEELEIHLHDAGAAKIAARAYLDHAAGRQGILFAPTVASAHIFARQFTRAGIPAEPAWGIMPLADRHDLLERFAAGKIQVVCNAQIFTEGTDLPFVSCVVIARPTRSSTLFVQMAGRALRPHPGKVDALVLDIVGASEDHRLANIINLSSRTRDVEIYYGAGGDEVDLLEAVDKLYEEKGRKGASGRMTYEDVDLFTGSRSAWLQTHQGLWFVPTATSVFFLYPDPDGTYRVVQRTRTGGYNRLHRGLDLSYAMSWAEQYANAEDSDSSFSIGSRQAAWRRKKAKPTKSQIEFAHKNGIKVDDEHRAELSDKISVELASRYLDQWVK